MPKALIITVGGSDKPVVNALKSYKNQADFIYFICSAGKGPASSSLTIDGEGNAIFVKGVKCPECNVVIKEDERRENILKQSGYGEDYERYKKIEIDNPDNFEEVYQKTLSVIKEAKQNGYEIIADFTGGTKTMSSVLAMLSALDFEIKPSLVIGERRDLIKTSSVSIPVILDVDQPRVDFTIKTADNLISRYFYYPASLILEELLKKGLRHNLAEEIRKKYTLCKAFSYWDSFDYEKAFEILKDYAETYKNELNYLRKLLKKTKSTEYEPVFDLILNAKRQAYNGYYDNAIARLYRGLELFAQTRLRKELQIDTSALEKSVDKLKSKEKWETKRNKQGKIQIGLKEDYELLMELDDPIGKVYEEQKDRFIDNIALRNKSKLAHGDVALTEKEWNDFFKFFQEFIEACCKNINLSGEYIELPNKL